MVKYLALIPIFIALCHVYWSRKRIKRDRKAIEAALKDAGYV
ncbi:hypothetical protein LCGC14_1743780 [marine sediment metagenome]|uniref:Uncharacterized protein n=1 Tax=marine sediment metagenome TaxID=412755 RepID=A0A0F9JL64_9ZZZZ